jgi:hypothetical protein
MIALTQTIGIHKNIDGLGKITIQSSFLPLP